MAVRKNIFTWSKTRDETFRTCPRRYYYEYYGAWGGWLVTAPAPVRKIYTLKQLKTRALWTGERVHECIERCLRNLRRGIRPMTEAEAVAATLALMREDFSGSRRGGFWKNPKSCGLFEHAYGVKTPDAYWKEAAGHVTACLTVFYRSAIYARIQALPKKQWLELEEFSSFPLDGVKIHVKLDFAGREGDDVVIYDWKTGTSDTRRSGLQLACYGFYAAAKWKAEPKHLRLVEFNLAANREHIHPVSAADLDAVKTYIRGSIRDMKLLLDDPETNTASEEKFPLVETDAPCGQCNYRMVCTRFAEKPHHEITK
ncbi:MAG: PD-(D/E)XK nuclease family protein [Planctomycetota bacterium]